MAPQKSALTGVIIGVIVIVALIWLALSRTATAPEETTTGTPEAVPAAQPIAIGWLGPLTGDAASYGQSIKRGVELAQQDFGLTNVRLIFEDGKCEGKEAVTAINKLITTDQVPAIIGEVCSGATLAAAPIAQQQQVVLMSAASTSPNVSDAGEYVFRTVPSDALQGEFGAELVFGDGHKRLAVLYSNEEYGLGFSRVLADSFTSRGGQVVANEAFERTSVDLRTQLAKIKNARPDALYLISNSPDSAIAALNQLKQLGLTAALYGSEGIKNPDIVSGAGPAAEGLVVTSVSSGSQDFITRHQQAYGEEPGPFAAQAYDAYAALARAIQQGATSGPAIREALAALEFDGASGHIVFDEKGDVEGNYDVLIVSNSLFVPRLITSPTPNATPTAATPSPTTATSATPTP